MHQAAGLQAGDRGERQTSAVVIICGIGFLDLALCCLSTKPRFGFTPYFEEVFIQEQEKREISMFRVLIIEVAVIIPTLQRWKLS